MIKNSASLQYTCQTNSASDSDYTVDPPRFCNTSIQIPNTNTIASGTYAAFFTTEAGRAASYSTTSLQASYRSINTSLQSRLKIR